MNPKNVVLQLVPCLDQTYGGQTVSAPSLATALLEEGWRSIFASVGLPERETINPLMGPHQRYWMEAAASKRLRFGHYSADLPGLLERVIAEHRPSVVHMHAIWNYPSWMAFRAAKAANIPIVISPRSELLGASLARSRLKKAIARKLYGDQLLHAAAGFHATDAAEAKAIENLGYKASVLTSPNGVDASLGENLPESGDAKTALGLPADRRYMLYLSRVHSRKNPDLFQKAAIESGMLDRGWSLIVAGPIEDAALAERMKAEAAARGVADRIHWLGHVGWEKKRLCYAASEIYALPTEFENFGNTIIEAFVCQTPVITSPQTPWGKLPETGGGWIAAPELQALTLAYNAGSKMATAELQAMGEKAKTMAEPYSWRRAGREMASFYSKLKTV